MVYDCVVNYASMVRHPKGAHVCRDSYMKIFVDKPTGVITWIVRHLMTLSCSFEICFPPISNRGRNYFCFVCEVALLGIGQGGALTYKGIIATILVQL